MQRSTGHSRLATLPLLLVLTLAAGCGEPTDPEPKERPAVPPPTVDRGSLRVSLATTGVDVDPDGYVLVVDSTRRSVRLNDTVEVGSLTLSSAHTVGLYGVATNCLVSDGAGSYNPGGYGFDAAVYVEGGKSTPVAFTVSCVARSVPPALATTQLLFVRGGQIYRARADGTGLVALSTGWDPVWSPDGQRIAFVRDSGIYVMNADGANARLVGLAPSRFEPSSRPTWSPDGERLAFTAFGSDDYCIMVVPLDGSADPACIAKSASTPAWSPDGSKIAFLADDQTGRTAVWTMEPDGSNPRQLTDYSGFGDPTWSPDGKQLALSSSSGVAAMNADGSGLRVLTSLYGERPTWSPDGRAIAFSVWYLCQGCEPFVFSVTDDGTALGLLIENASSPSWHK